MTHHTCFIFVLFSSLVLSRITSATVPKFPIIAFSSLPCQSPLFSSYSIIYILIILPPKGDSVIGMTWDAQIIRVILTESRFIYQWIQFSL